jgi:hypothetical protein
MTTIMKTSVAQRVWLLRTVWLFGIGRDLHSRELLLERATPEGEVDEDAFGLRMAARFGESFHRGGKPIPSRALLASSPGMQIRQA